MVSQVTKEAEGAALRELMRGIKQAEFAKNKGLPGGPSMLSQHLSGHRPISPEAALVYADGLGVSVREFSPRLADEIDRLRDVNTNGEQAPRANVELSPGLSPPVAEIADDDSAVPSGYVRLQHLSPVPTMGDGASIDEPVTVLQYVDVLAQWVRERVGTPNPARIKILTARGSSMRGTIQDQDIVFVDITQQSIDAPGIYVLDVAGRFLLKRALIQGNGTLILRSDNVDEYPDEERYDLAKYATVIHVAGRVCAWWTLRRP